MADQNETVGVQNSPSGSESKELHSESKADKQNGTSGKSPSSQTTYIQQVSVTNYFEPMHFRSTASSHCLEVALDLYAYLLLQSSHM